LNVVDICLAHPDMAEDDAANQRLITALGEGVFHPPAHGDVCVHTFTFLRSWHWRQPPAHELILEVLKTATESAVVNAAIQLLYYADAETIIAGANELVAATHPAANEAVANSLGQRMGEAALRFPAVAAELCRWLETPPTSGTLATAEALKRYLRGVSPPAAEGTIFTGITGTQGTSYCHPPEVDWGGQGAPPAPSEASLPWTAPSDLWHPAPSTDPERGHSPSKTWSASVPPPASGDARRRTVRRPPGGSLATGDPGGSGTRRGRWRHAVWHSR
jgi:hypothetical protein